ncbi:hypothetical protein IEZ26_01575 [Nocardioides cavernae]|uniref:TY-Chap central domain-containing protein n=1 Tax=Nocardioides cavernae TaxID=1921566 RepID=A0ABR8N6U9_9ACTN|nr:YbjN domain-containing protein [Nocardioides cavernae]MBD3923296.1 hypothetical protein [Nocardioides cavernae]MBM7511782.1 hypothetical protein [Nocardioides cavernae]
MESILEGNGLSWTGAADALTFRFSSALVSVSFRSWGSQSLIEIRSDVLRHVEAEDGRVLTRLNELNCREVFGRWAYYSRERVIALEYDMLGDHLQEPELMAAFTSMAQLADYHDDLLQAELGGSRGVD